MHFHLFGVDLGDDYCVLCLCFVWPYRLFEGNHGTPGTLFIYWQISARKGVMKNPFHPLRHKLNLSLSG
jgi:hypothetical protein